MPKLLLFFSHTLTPEQQQDAEKNWGVVEFVSLPEGLQSAWSNVPPEGKLIPDYLQQFTDFISESALLTDYLLIQGEYGLTVSLTEWAIRNGYTALYSTTKRVYQHRTLADGSTENVHVIKHIQFRKFELLL